MDRYAVLDKLGKVVNVIVWDGLDKWSPPEEHTVQHNEECSVGDIWHQELNEFVRPLSLLKSPEDDESVRQRKEMYEKSKESLKSSMLFLNQKGDLEI